jgi:hypothetical protein
VPTQQHLHGIDPAGQVLARPLVEVPDAGQLPRHAAHPAQLRQLAAHRRPVRAAALVTATTATIATTKGVGTDARAFASASATSTTATQSAYTTIATSTGKRRLCELLHNPHHLQLKR